MTDAVRQLAASLMDDSKESSIPILKELGFHDPEKSCNNFSTLFKSSLFISGEGDKERFILAAADSPDPDLALNNILRVISALPEKINKEDIFRAENLPALCTICGGSRFLTNIILRRPLFLENLLAKGKLYSSSTLADKTDELNRALEPVDDYNLLLKVLRDYKAMEYLRIGARDLIGLAPLTEVMAELSDLASAALQGACNISGKLLKKEYGSPLYTDENEEEREARFVILGMGKFGGCELNFSSDIDLIFLYTTDRGETSGTDDTNGKKISLHEYFTKLGKMVIKAINDVTEDGFVFRVDMNLRPEGQSGDLACSVRSAEIYYESWGQAWERSAMLKARPVAGNIELGEEFLRMIRPFQYRKFLDYTAIEEIRAMKKKIDAVIAREDETFTNLKLGTGGIREIEFFIQALQLIHGGKKEGIRERNSLKALQKLKKEKLITEEEESHLSAAYIFLRQVEHRIQIFEERQTHTLPAEREKLEKLARRAGYRENALEQFLSDHRMHTGNVKEVYSSLFHEAAEKLEDEKTPEIMELLEGTLPENASLERLSSFGFSDPATARKNLLLLWNGPPFAHFTEKARSVLRRVAPFIFMEITASPEPGMALNNFEKFINAVGARATLYSLLAENHHVIKLLVGLFGTSEFLSKILLTYPETLDSLVSPGSSSPFKTKEQMREELFNAHSAVEYYEDKLDAMRRFRNVEILRIGINDIYGEIGLEEVSKQITYLADVALELACSMALEKTKERYGSPLLSDQKSESAMVVLGMGKMGGQEMAYSSDLDIIFIYSGAGETSGEHNGKTGLKVITNQEFFSKVAQVILSILSIPTREGYMFKVDTRLRPSGSSGSLVVSFNAFRDYHNKSAQTWERQALTRARVVAGDAALGEEVVSIIEENIYGREGDEDLRAEIVRMRKKMEFELAKESDGIYNVKTGKGGIVDIEFLVQYMLLKYGPDDRKLPSANTGKALKKLGSAGILPEDDYIVLSSAYNFLRTLENSMRIVHDQSISRLDTASKDFDRLARRLGHDRTGLLTNYITLTGKVRDIYNRYLEAKET